MRRRIVSLGLIAALISGCTATTSQAQNPPKNMPLALRLVSYDSCADLLTALRGAARANVGPWGYYGGVRMLTDLAVPAPADAMSKSATGAQGQTGYSGTNNHEAGVDEPDMVKTDGKRIVVISGSTLHVIDAASRRETSRLTLAGYGADQLLLEGDRLLILGNNAAYTIASGAVQAPLTDAAVGKRMPGPMPWYPQATQLTLVDLAGGAKVIGEYRIDAGFVDARMVGGVARVVVRSHPVLQMPVLPDTATEAERLKANQEMIDKAPIEAWMPKYQVGGKTESLDCRDVSRPQDFSGTSMITLLSFDLKQAATLDAGRPVSVMADAETVYGSGSNLYLARDQSWRYYAQKSGSIDNKGQTDLFQFDVSTPTPSYVAGGSVVGHLLNQYSMSEHNGALRVATTNTDQSSSTVYVLRREGGELKLISEVGGLGKKERIYAVRFIGPIGYVVTFRQTDPLYTIDLRNPEKPKVAGELKIPGYSSYLHPVGEGKLLGVGQAANSQGRVQGTQISLFDVSNVADPRRVAQEHLGQAQSEAEYDPHAFLYWPQANLLVIPVWTYNGRSGAQLVRVEGGKLTPIAFVTHEGGQAALRRSLVIDQTLWTISDAGALATDLDGQTRQAWVRLT